MKLNGPLLQRSSTVDWRGTLRLFFLVLAFAERGDSFTVGRPAGFTPNFRPEYVSQQSRSLSCRNLFFKSDPVAQRKASNLRVSPEVWEALSCGRLGFELPYRTPLKSPNWMRNPEDDSTALLTVRLLETRDIAAITDLCLEEYGSGPENFPGVFNSNDFGDWVDRQGLRQLVDTTMRMKIVPNSKTVSDHAIIVACLSTPRKEQLVGMIEVSRQPVLPNRNPPPVPIPLFFKQLYCKIANKPLDAWIANLLVAPQARGMGLGKMLVGAAEGLARCSWKCQAIHLHCDADGVSGNIPQRLYLSMGYETTTNTTPSEDISWMMEFSGNAIDYTNSVYFIEGVPLLYLRKNLTSNNNNK
jgi:ribosomal protein S18 acetylase RimI-like enzyme